MGLVGGTMGVIITMIYGDVTPSLIQAIFVWLSAGVFKVSPPSTEKTLANHRAVDGIVVNLYAP